MVEIDDKPILRCIMKIYSSDGANDFMSCSGHADYMVRGYFANYFLHMSATDSERVETEFGGFAIRPHEDSRSDVRDPQARTMLYVVPGRTSRKMNSN